MWAEGIVGIADDAPGNDMAQIKKAQLRINTRQWVMGKDNSRFADKPQIEITQNVLSMSPEARDKLALDLIGDLRAISEDNQARRAIETPIMEDQPERSDSGSTGGIGG
jgi:hypothetical protein